MSIPMTRSCPQCEAEMELLTTDDDGEVVVYECPDCGSQMETPVHDGELEDDQDFHPPLDTDEAGAEFEPEDAS